MGNGTKSVLGAMALGLSLVLVIQAPVAFGGCTTYDNHKIGVYDGDVDCVYRPTRTCEKCTDGGGLVCLASEEGECIDNVGA